MTLAQKEGEKMTRWFVLFALLIAVGCSGRKTDDSTAQEPEDRPLSSYTLRIPTPEKTDEEYMVLINPVFKNKTLGGFTSWSTGTTHDGQVVDVTLGIGVYDPTTIPKIVAKVKEIGVSKGTTITKLDEPLGEPIKVE